MLDAVFNLLDMNGGKHTLKFYNVDVISDASWQLCVETLIVVYFALNEMSQYRLFL